MKSSEIILHIRNYCRENADPAIVLKYSRYFKEGYDAYGLTHEKTLAETDYIFENNKHLTQQDILLLGKELFASGKYEEGSIAMLLLMKFKKQFSSLTLEGVGEWFNGGINNWGHTDFMSGEVLGEMLLKKAINYTDFSGWITSKYRFKRRAVPVSLIKPVKNGMEIPLLLSFIEPLMMDNERVVHQGVGWLLREAWKRNPKPVEDFLHKWKHSAARLIYQYATEKMTPEKKQEFKRPK
ncbi:MAG: DNA alkylation repair protein [Lentimicrobiaceae bacterium]|nr:DNA alkylation repair protein [Lentimicrobiaceae bacterium]